MKCNDYYGGLNRRFDRRARLLVGHGYRFELAEFPAYEGDRRPASVGVFIRRTSGRNVAVASSLVMHADKRAWLEELSRLLKRSWK